VKADTLTTILAGSGQDLRFTLTDPAVKYLVDLAAVIDAHPDYESTLLYSANQQFATQSDHLDPFNPGVEIGLGAPAETLTTARGVHDDAELRAQILDAHVALEAHLSVFDPTYSCRFGAYPNHAHTQWAMSTLNELGYTAFRSGPLGQRPFFSAASAVRGFMSSYEIPLSSPRPNNAWSEATTRSTYQSRKATWKAKGEWAILLVHGESESDSAHVEWMMDEIASDPAIWIAPFGEVADFFDTFYTDVGYPVDSTGVVSAWIHGLDPTDTTWVVVTAYSDSLQESVWSNEIAILPFTAVAVVQDPPPAMFRTVATPNPFRAATSILFHVAQPAAGRLEILDLRGRRVLSRDLGRLAPGPARVGWDGRGAAGEEIAAGVYFYRITVAGETAQGKVALLR
jgi:hypothetical protein